MHGLSKASKGHQKEVASQLEKILSRGDSSIFGYQNNRKKGRMAFPWQCASLPLIPSSLLLCVCTSVIQMECACSQNCYQLLLYRYIVTQLPRVRLPTSEEAEFTLREQSKKGGKNQVLSGRQAMSKDRPSVTGRNFRTSESLEKPDNLSPCLQSFVLKSLDVLNIRQSEAKKLPERVSHW